MVKFDLLEMATITNKLQHSSVSETKRLYGVIILAICLILSGCSSSRGSDKPTIKFDGKDVEIEFLEFEKKEDIDDKEGIFVFANVINKSKEVVYPESIWTAHIAFVESQSKDRSSLYQRVLPKKDLDGSSYQTAIKKMSQPIQPGKKAKVGFFCGGNKEDVELILYDENHKETASYPLKKYIKQKDN